MTILNQSIFVTDPTSGDIPNLGVAKVQSPGDAEEWSTLEWELRSFVCEGEYERGLERILSQYLSHLNQAQQPAVWVSGFYGSGKSHLMRVLEYLWRDDPLPSGATPRELVLLPSDIEQNLAELSTAARREGGLWSAAGTLGLGASGSVRLAFLEVIFGAAGIPLQIAPAKFTLFLLEEDGMYDAVVASVRAAGKDFEREVSNLYVSPVLAQALIDAGAQFGTTPAEVSKALQSQFRSVDDVSNDEMLDIFERVLKLQSDTPGKLPLTLIILDEMQQYISDEGSKALKVQELVEGCSSRFGSQVLVVATGQSALTANPTLQKLIDRFSVTVALSDTDVESVVRQVVLRKRSDFVKPLQECLDGVSGEIDRQLGGTRLESKAADAKTLISDYPLLPTRRRFLEKVLRALDKTGKAGVLRTQLKIVHEASRSVADRPIGHVIGADFVFNSESASMLQSGVLLKDIDELIRGLDDGTSDGKLKSRVCAMVFLISQLPTEGAGDTGVRATAPLIADLLVEDLAVDGSTLRKEVPRLLDELVEDGRVVKIEDEYRLQTEEGAEWTKDFNQRRSNVRDDASRMSQLRSEWLHRSVDDGLAGLKVAQGNSKTPRRIERSWDQGVPVSDGATIPVWIRDEWSLSEAQAKQAAAEAGNESPIVFVFLPKIEAETIRDLLATHAAAQDVITQRPEPQTEQGRQAKQGMRSRLAESEQRLGSLFSEVVHRALVFQGGGGEIAEGSLLQSVEAACMNALARLFPKFSQADNPNWDKVVARVRDGAPDALKAVGWSEEVTANPVCKEVLSRISGSGIAGNEIQKQLGESPYGWPKDAIDGSLLVLLAHGNLRVEREHQPIASAKELPATHIGKATFFKEDEPPTMSEKLAVRGLLTAAEVEYQADREAAAISALLQRLQLLAEEAGGPAPLPEPPTLPVLTELSTQAGNQQFRALAGVSEELIGAVQEWRDIANKKRERLQEWEELDRLLRHAGTISGRQDVAVQRDGIVSGRLLITEPDPVRPLVETLGAALRAAVQAEAATAAEAFERELQRLEESSEWSELESGEREALLQENGLVQWTIPAVATNTELLDALDASSIQTWIERRQALPAKVDAARKSAIRKIEPESVSIRPKSATIRTEGEVDEYIDALRSALMHEIQAGKTVIV